MGRQKYQFNLESLTFTKARRGVKHYLLLLVRYFFASVALAFFSYLIYSLFLDTPRERQLAQDNVLLAEYLDKLNERYQHIAAVLEDIRQRDDNIYRTIFESEPIQNDEQESERMVNSLFKNLREKGADSIVSRTSSLLHDVVMDVADISVSFDTLIMLAQASHEFVKNIPSILPLSNAHSTRIAAPFGMRMHPFYKVLKMHEGVDFASNVGNPVRATAAGIVTNLSTSKRGLGNTVALDHGNGYTTLYAHLDELKVRTGQHIAQGDIVGTVGNSGMSMAPHLHYEVHFHGEAVDPLHYFFLDLDPLALGHLAQRALQSGQSLD